MKLSIGAKWTLRYAVVSFVAISLLGWYVYTRAEGRLRRDAELITRAPLRNVAEAMKRRPGDINVVAEAIDREVTAADGDLRLGIQYFDENGRVVLASGSLEQRPIPLPASILEGRRAALFWEKTHADDRRYYVVTSKAPEGYLQTAVYTRRFDKHASYIADGFYVAMPIALLMTAGLGWLLARGSLRPIKRMTRTARHINVSNLDEDVPTTGSGDELDQLAGTLNEMLGRIRRSVSRIRRFNADAAHELRTPLAAIRSQVEVTLERERPIAEYERVLANLLGEVDRLAAGADAMLRLAQSEAGVDPTCREEVALGQLLGEVVDFFGPLATEAGVKLDLREADLVPTLHADPAWLHQLFANLVHNAIKFTPSGGSVLVRVSPEPGGDGGMVEVVDTGVGIPPEHLDRIFERFHKEDAARSEAGFGLGLSLVREIVRAHGGSIRVESTPDEGSTFRVILPHGGAPEA